MSKIINCLKIVEEGYTFLTEEIQHLRVAGLTPTFATIIVGKNPASLIYVRNKKKKSKSLGINNTLYELGENITEIELLNLIEQLNLNRNINGILVQMPLPKHIKSENIIRAITPQKDIDGLHPQNLGNLILNRNQGFLKEYDSREFIPCTPLGCIHILHSLGLSLEGKKAIVIGRSTLVGIPMAHLLLNNNCTVTMAHSKTPNIKEICLNADILVVASGIPNLIDETFIKERAVVIDVGISKINIDGKERIVGDVDIKSALKKVSFITTVPKGVGLLTIMFLMYNIVKACKLQNSKL